MKRNIRELLETRRVFLDGGTGTLLQAAGLLPGEPPEHFNLTNKSAVAAVHRAYFDAGSDIVCANTFGVNSLKYTEKEVKEYVSAAVEIADAERLRAEKVYGKAKFVALDIGPLGKLIKPFGDLEFEDAVAAFANTINAGKDSGVDLIYFETFNDTLEAKAALIAAKENSSLPVFISFAFDGAGRLLSGSDPLAALTLAEGFSVAAVGANCGVGPDLILSVAQTLAAHSSTPVIIKPNAGLPHDDCGKTVFDVTPECFSEDMKKVAELGVSVLGGCCGTTPEHIKTMKNAVSGVKFQKITDKNETRVSSYSHSVEIGKSPVIIGERINPTGKKAFKEALLNDDISYILNEGIAQQKAGAHILDVNVGLPGIDEVSMMKKVVGTLQSVVDLPLQIDTSDKDALEAALRIYNGVPIINSVNGKRESLETVLPLAKKYGGVVVGLALDESGIPDTAEGRAKIAERIIKTAEGYGISRKNIIIDTLTLTVAVDKNAGNITLDALKTVKERFGVGSCLGVSNISFGLPDRDKINAEFLSAALDAGLSAAIINPLSPAMNEAFFGHSSNVGAKKEFSYSVDDGRAATASASSLYDAIVSGLCDDAAKFAEKELAEKSPIGVIDGSVIPALTKVGDGFSNGTVFLPQLLMSAEAAHSAFVKIKKAMPATGGDKKETIILATVKGDIHDIGKNIVKALLENYNYNVIDLGRDVPPEKVVEVALDKKVKLVGLSALMTTTVPAMKETVEALHKANPTIKVMVGGAVLTEDYAKNIGADSYSKDAIGAVRYADKIFGH